MYVHISQRTRNVGCIWGRIKVQRMSTIILSIKGHVGFVLTIAYVKEKHNTPETWPKRGHITAKRYGEKVNLNLVIWFLWKESVSKGDVVDATMLIQHPARDAGFNAFDKNKRTQQIARNGIEWTKIVTHSPFKEWEGRGREEALLAGRNGTKLSYFYDICSEARRCAHNFVPGT